MAATGGRMPLAARSAAFELRADARSRSGQDGRGSSHGNEGTSDQVRCFLYRCDRNPKERSGSLPSNGRVDLVRVDPAARAHTSIGPAAYVSVVGLVGIGVSFLF